jgi:hypothetical protein
MSGCQSDRPRPIQYLLGSILQTHCSEAHALIPGTKYIDYDHGGGWVQVGTDGQVRPIPNPQEAVPEAFAR